MKKILTILVFLAITSIFIFSTVSAAPTGSYVSGISCVNLQGDSGNFSITFYYQNGNQAASISDTISGYGSKLYFTPSISELPADFFGSAVVKSSVQMACSINTQTDEGILRVGTSNGVSSTAANTKLYVPQVMNTYGGFSTYIAVQNTTTSTESVTVYYFNASGVQVSSETVDVPSNSSHTFFQDEGSSGLPTGFFGSATVESSADLVGVVALYNAGADAGSAQFLSYNAFTAGANKVFGPRVVKNLSGVGYTTGITCQNVGTENTDITAQLAIYDQDTQTIVNGTLNATNIAPKQSWAFYFGPNVGVPALDAIVKGYGSAVIESDQPIACIFNEDNRTTYAGLGSTYNGIPDGNQSTTMSFPQVVALGSSSYRGGFQISNTTAVATTCTYTFSNGDVISDVPLAANGSNSEFAENILINNKTSFNGSVIVTCGQPIVGIYNLAAQTIPGDSFATNNGINR
jgi:hypothetical protein